MRCMKCIRNVIMIFLLMIRVVFEGGDRWLLRVKSIKEIKEER